MIRWLVGSGIPRRTSCGSCVAPMSWPWRARRANRSPRSCGQRKILSPAAKRRAVDMLTTTLSMSERLACKAVGLARSTYRRLPLMATPADPDAQLRAWLHAYATKHPCHGFRRAWAALRHDERREVNKKKVHRLWREEGLQVKVTSPRKRAGVSSVPQILLTHRRWCGRSISSSTPPSKVTRSRSPR
jgi:hypothetical protein